MKNFKEIWNGMSPNMKKTMLIILTGIAAIIVSCSSLTKFLGKEEKPILEVIDKVIQTEIGINPDLEDLIPSPPPPTAVSPPLVK
jgi:predicted small secreted protein